MVFGFGEKNNEAKEEEQYEQQSAEQSELQDDTFQQQEGARASDSYEFNAMVLNPIAIKNSVYHQMVSKDLAVSKLTRDDVAIIEQELSLITQFLNNEMYELADVYHSEMLGRTTTFRSIDGFERKQQNTLKTELNKSVTTSGPVKPGFFNRG